MTSTWVYDTAANGIGKLASATANIARRGPRRHQKSFVYDSLGRPVQVTIVINTVHLLLSSTPAYDANSRLVDRHLSLRLRRGYSYTRLGYA